MPRAKDQREYSPGWRTRKYANITKGKYVDERMAWVRTLLGQIVLMHYPEGTEIADKSNEPGPTVKVLIPRPNARTVHWDITSLTLEELEKMREFFTLVFDTAEPIVRMRDEVAANANTEGDDSIARIYRQVPQLVVRPRKEREYGEGVQRGLEDVSEGSDDDGASDDLDGGLRGHGGVLADEGAQDGSDQDYREETD